MALHRLAHLFRLHREVFQTWAVNGKVFVAKKCLTCGELADVVEIQPDVLAMSSLDTVPTRLAILEEKVAQLQKQEPIVHEIRVETVAAVSEPSQLAQAEEDLRAELEALTETLRNQTNTITAFALPVLYNTMNALPRSHPIGQVISQLETVVQMKEQKWQTSN